MSTEPYRIDVHHHIVPSEYVDALKSIGITSSGRVPFPQWTPETSITAETVKGIKSYDAFDLQTRTAIEKENALRFFPRLRRT
jgi:hypothetical protein